MEKSFFMSMFRKALHYGRIQADNLTPYPKNPIIVNFFNNIGRADELGSGVRNLYKYTKKYSYSEPMLIEDDIFRIEIPLIDISKSETEPIGADKPQINAKKSFFIICKKTTVLPTRIHAN